MGPLAEADGHDAPGLVDALVPGFVAMVDDVLAGSEHAVGEPVVAHELPDVLGGVEFGGFRRQEDDRDIGRDGELVGYVPTRLIDERAGVGAVRLPPA
jgi:hypothetical protein